ncbi:MAG: hypothetical protein IJ506_07515 [Clostridia bacterium]|nr:hypothetical protein [Clostridia bacterium]MBQ8658969.1 hypothetical protein [Clostridia bacterium]
MIELLQNREKIKEILLENEYGRFPTSPTRVYAEELPVSDADKVFCAGKAPIERYLLKADVYGKTVAFPIVMCFPKGAKKPVKTVVSLNFEREIPNKYFPAEEIIDRGWAFAFVCYEDITVDSEQADENAKILTTEFYTGKLVMWAWAAMRIRDFLETFKEVDQKNVAIVGHSRLGKTALLTAAFDERFAFVHSNNSGVGGAALYREINQECEDIRILATVRPYWFSKKYPSFIGKEKELTFDQDCLLRLIAPRVLSVSSASGDPRANPKGELNGARFASSAWESLDVSGLIAPQSAEIGVPYHEGKVGYYLREGYHYFSREDWNVALTFFEKNLVE